MPIPKRLSPAPQSIKDLNQFHMLVLQGINNGRTYRAMASDIGKSIGMIQIYVDDLVNLFLVKRMKIGGKNKLEITETGRKVLNGSE